MATVAETLEMAASLIEPEGAWTQGAFARHANGNAIGAQSPNAKCFCMAGAIYAVSPTKSFGSDVIDRLPKPRGYANIAEWNDAPRRKQSEVVSALRAAAAKAREVRS